MSSSKPLGLVRVKDPETGAEFNASRQYAKVAGFTVTEKPVVDKYGRPVPAKGKVVDKYGRPAPAKGNPIQPAAKSPAKSKES